ncbi:hypothetical protein OIE13_22355 [Streptosporangium sp. NBC_01810]|uniref:hypothetical protein n=1 Tax=Streptosporangium sp. NBC_01810 TaxID=2975951 RepID=UPI002DD8A1F2|nr:hypothetical protein [Streptosporangium sp. NBC_01810]WSA23686.1 hypothetical protein OIE13_22355 [Streptosporangium sp. NBC_01810]
MAPTEMDATSILINPWFDLHRHDEDATSEETGDTDTTETEEIAADSTTEAEDDTSDDGLGDAGKKALAETRAERNRAKKEASDAKKEAAEAKKRAAAAEAKVAKFEEANKTEAEKLAARAEQAEARAKAATERAVKSEIKAIASATFRDPTDADAIGDLTVYVSDDGDIDVERIKADLDDLLERKPHWRKPEEVSEPEPTQKRSKPAPKPDPGQGPRKEPGPVDFRTADKATVDAELARLGVRVRS